MINFKVLKKEPFWGEIDKFILTLFYLLGGRLSNILAHQKNWSSQNFQFRQKKSKFSSMLFLIKKILMKVFVNGQ